MDKEKLLHKVSDFAEKGEITKKDLIDAYNSGIGKAGFNITAICSFFGSFILFLGILFFSSIYRANIGPFGHITITLVAGFFAYIIGVILINLKGNYFLSNGSFLISALLIPIGVFVFKDVFEFGLFYEFVYFVVFFGFLSILYFIANNIRKSNFLVLLIIIFGSISFLYFILFLNYFLELANIGNYTYIFLGAFYIILGLILLDSFYNILSYILFWVGSFFIYISLFLLVFDSVFWESFFAIWLIISLFVSFRYVFKPFLVFGLLFFVMYIFYLTSEYFGDIIARPLVLIIIGLIIISIPYLGLHKLFRK